MPLDFALVLVESIFENNHWMEEPDIESGAEWTLLQLREDVSVQYSPIRVQSSWI